MPLYKNVAGQYVSVRAWDNAAGDWKTGDAANISAYICKDAGTPAATNDTNPSEVDATNMPGLYRFALTQAETNADLFEMVPKSSTADVVVEGVSIHTTPGSNAGITAADVTLADGAHGGSSAVLTLKNTVINNPAGVAIDIDASSTGVAINSSGQRGLTVEGASDAVAFYAGGNGNAFVLEGAGTGADILLDGSGTIDGTAFGTDDKVLLSTDAQTGVTIPTVTDITNGVTIASTDFLVKIIKGRKILDKTGSVWSLIVYDPADDSTPILTKALKDKDGSDITDLDAGVLAMELLNSV
jgi:hypothetical protein